MLVLSAVHSLLQQHRLLASSCLQANHATSLSTTPFNELPYLPPNVATYPSWISLPLMSIVVDVIVCNSSQQTISSLSEYHAHALITHHSQWTMCRGLQQDRNVHCGNLWSLSLLVHSMLKPSQDCFVLRIWQSHSEFPVWPQLDHCTAKGNHPPGDWCWELKTCTLQLLFFMFKDRSNLDYALCSYSNTLQLLDIT